MNILGISRAARFSPNSTARDAAIFEAVAGVLRSGGHSVTTCDEDDYRCADGYDAVFSMGRDVAFLQHLAVAEAAGTRVVNAPSALLSGSRRALAQRFEAAHLPVAPSTDVSRYITTAAVSVPTALAPTAARPQWLKRGEACAQSATDVRLVTSADELRAALADFARRGVTQALLSPHIAGDLVKFYGVEGTEFFDYYYPTASADAFSKFGLERHNGRPRGFALNAAVLKCDADAAARVSGFTVYGGDAIVTADGRHVIIDFNDWPSFSRCCAPAAAAIAARLLSDSSGETSATSFTTL